MKEAIAKLIGRMTFTEALMALGFVVVCVVVLLFAIAATLDRLNVKSFSFTKGFTFYQDGDVKKSRITRKTKTVKRTANR